jgi:hypothetical protein
MRSISLMPVDHAGVRASGISATTEAISTALLLPALRVPCVT